MMSKNTILFIAFLISCLALSPDKNLFFFPKDSLFFPEPAASSTFQKAPVFSFSSLFPESKWEWCLQGYDSTLPGAYAMEKYFPLLSQKRVGIVTNQTGIIQKKHLIDTLLQRGIWIKKIFTPEHGFRGSTDAGILIENSRDSVHGIPVISLYGKKKKPSATDLKNLDVLIFDLQDVGVRFYTYLSTLHYVMEACAENNKPLIVLDRPNPNGFYIDGPVMKKELRSFLGLHPVPVVYGMTIGEYALMINGEGWLTRGKKCKLKIIPCGNYRRNCSVRLPVPPSPNLNTPESVLLYPTLGLLEGSIASVGRGTSFPFCSITHPEYPDTTFCVTPQPNAISKKPKYAGIRCCGTDLRQNNYLKNHPRKIQLEWIRTFALVLKKENFFNEHFEAHAGNVELRHQLVSRISISDIRASWQKDIETFKNIRKKYLLYPDFE